MQLLDLPISRQSSQSASTTSTTTSSPTPQSPTTSLIDNTTPFTFNNHPPSSHRNHEHLHRVHYLPPSQKHSPPSDASKSDTIESTCVSKDDIYIKPDDSTLKGDYGRYGSQDSMELKDYSYVVFKSQSSKPHSHEYSYPTLESVQKPPSKRESTTSNVKRQPLLTHSPHPPLPKKDKSKKTERLIQKNQKLRCKHCHELFSYDENPRGSCEDAPDGVEKCIEYVTCVWCAKGLIYHCMADPDGDYGHPCVCDMSDDSNCKKWTALTVLSLFLPCLWCYPALMACHSRGVGCGCCGGRHKAT